MYNRRTSLESVTDFRFPFVPYDIQQYLMESLYKVIERGQIGIFESATGTGKSLTLTCGALKWLEDHENAVKSELDRRLAELTQEIDNLEEKAAASPHWIEVQFGSIQKKNEANELRKVRSLIAECEKRVKELKERRARVKLKDLAKGRKQEPADKMAAEDSGGDEDSSLGDYQSDAIQQDDLEKDESRYKNVKLYFCSRTHSQLSQVAREIKRTEYASNIRCVSLASRQNLCINPAVKKLQSSSLINERCLDMQKSQSKATSSDTDGRAQKKSRTEHMSSCPFKSLAVIEELRDASLVEIADIEDLVSAGETLKACPYYSSRSAVKDAQVVLMPYQMLLHHKTRIQSGIDLHNSVVIIDEAHNLLDTICDIYSSEVSLLQLQVSQQQLIGYRTKYSSRLNTQNLLKINQLIFVTKRLAKLLTDPCNTTSRMLRTHELMSEGEFFNIDLFQILEFCDQTRLARKVQGYAQREVNRRPIAEKENDGLGEKGATGLLRKLEEERVQQKSAKTKSQEIESQGDGIKEDEKKNPPSTLVPSAIRPLLAFLESLTECSVDGQVLLQFSEDPEKARMKFMLLNPNGHFNELTTKCRALIIAGGTMQPTDELINQLFPTCVNRVKQFFFGHVIPDESVRPFIVSRGPTDKRLNFSYANRQHPEMLFNLGMILQNACVVIPAGIVCFFGSYDYLDLVYKFFEENQIIASLEKRKFVFREPRVGGQQLEKVLGEYAVAIADPRRKGAILFSVVGGKLSEGLNFTDDLGRCVIVVGMPYPNKKSVELQEKMKYLDHTLGSGSGVEYYENLCMKAVNQCIGRSVRHIKDYASVLLIDERYNNERVKNKLPQWIARNLQTPVIYGTIHGALAKFFRDRRLK